MVGEYVHKQGKMTLPDCKNCKYSIMIFDKDDMMLEHRCIVNGKKIHNENGIDCPHYVQGKSLRGMG